METTSVILGGYALTVIWCLFMVRRNYNLWMITDKGDDRQVSKYFTWFVLIPMSFIPFVNIVFAVYVWEKMRKR